jgi:hypothetical protein
MIAPAALPATTTQLPSAQFTGIFAGKPPRKSGDGPPPITLHVEDVARSRQFYAEVLGFVGSVDSGDSDSRAVMVSPLLANGYRSVVLSRSRGPNSASGLLMELETTTELLDRYILARLMKAPTRPLTSRGRVVMTGVQDPDGHWIELRATGRHEFGRSEDHPARRARASRWGRHEDEPMDERRIEARQDSFNSPDPKE